MLYACREACVTICIASQNRIGPGQFEQFADSLWDAAEPQNPIAALERAGQKHQHTQSGAVAVRASGEIQNETGEPFGNKLPNARLGNLQIRSERKWTVQADDYGFAINLVDG